jgi:hypothetical protein
VQTNIFGLRFCTKWVSVDGELSAILMIGPVKGSFIIVVGGVVGQEE